MLHVQLLLVAWMVHAMYLHVRSVCGADYSQFDALISILGGTSVVWAHQKKDYFLMKLNSYVRYVAILYNAYLPTCLRAERGTFSQI